MDLRKVFWLTWLGVLIKPIVTIYNSFLLYRQAKLYDLMITPQVCYMEAMLNDRFDISQRRIFIDDAVQQPPVYLYTEAENHPLYLFTEAEDDPEYIYTEGEGADYGNDFVVWVPAAISFNAIEMRAMVMRKRLPGMRFTIQTF